MEKDCYTQQLNREDSVDHSELKKLIKYIE